MACWNIDSSCWLDLVQVLYRPQSWRGHECHNVVICKPVNDRLSLSFSAFCIVFFTSFKNAKYVWNHYCVPSTPSLLHFLYSLSLKGHLDIAYFMCETTRIAKTMTSPSLNPQSTTLHKTEQEQMPGCWTMQVRLGDAAFWGLVGI